MTQELKRLVRLAGCGALLCGGVVLAQDAAPVKPAAPVAPAAGVPGKHEVSQEVKDLRGKIEAQEKAVLEKKAKEKEEELNELAMIIGGCAFVVFLVAIGIYELMEFCATGRRCGR